MDANLLIFLPDDSVLLIEAPQIWHDRLSEAKSMILALIGIIGMLVAIFPLSLSLTIPFKKLAQKRENPRASLGPLASEEAIAIQDHINSLQRQFDREQESQIQSLASISHDLRTPVTRLRLRAEIMKEKEMQEKFLSDLEEISCLVEGALDLLSVRKLPEEHFKFSLDSLIQSLCDDYCDMGKDVRFDLPEQIEISGVASVFGGTAPVLISAETHGMMIGQPKKLRRALVNLIDNSLKYGRYARISLGYDGSDHLIIRIVDGGPGIPPEQMDQVMLPFVRGHWSKMQRGSGLGLSIANEIIKHHRGQLSLKNGPDGLLVEIHLPREAK
jgi:signal transduction histidine kinase